MPGFFSKVGTYMAGMGAIGRRTAMGAAMGGMYGMASEDTSVLGGMTMGAGMARYLGAGLGAAYGRGYANASLKTRAMQFARGMSVQARRDARGARMMANQGYGKFRSMFR